MLKSSGTGRSKGGVRAKLTREVRSLVEDSGYTRAEAIALVLAGVGSR